MNTYILGAGALLTNVVILVYLSRRWRTPAPCRCERRFRALIERASDGIALMDAEGRFLYQSPSSARILGISQPLEGSSAFPTLHPDDLADQRANFAELLAEPNRQLTAEVRYRHGDGSWHWMEATMTNLLHDPDVGAVVSNYRDITERRRDEMARRESEERFRQLTDHIKEAFFILDATSGEPLYISATWAEIWGRRLEDAQNPNANYGGIHVDDRPAIEQAFLAGTKGETTDTTFRVVRPDTTIRWVRCRMFPVRNAEGAIYRLAGVSEDITELRQTEERFIVAQKMEGIGRLAGGIAHDFNNLLTVMLGEADLIATRRRLSAQDAASLTQIRAATERAAALTRQLLSFSRRQLVAPTVLDVNTVVTNVGDMLRRLIGEDVVLRTSLEPELPAVRADQGQIEQVLTNLVVNAKDATSAGGSIVIDTREISVDEGFASAHPGLSVGHYVVIAVTDNGTGMSADVKARLFEPFFTTKEPGKGTGLGLATCFGIIKNAGGLMDVYSEPGIGTTVRAYLPVTSAAADRPRPAATTAPPRGHETVMLVEDERAVRGVIARMLRDHGYHVLEAASAEACLQLLQSVHEKPQLLLTDVVLPGIGGRQLADLVLALRPSIRVLFASGYSDDTILRQQLLAQDAELIQKPFTQEMLCRRVRTVLDAPAQAATLTEMVPAADAP
jgi:two-component system, cell cycle sensor histidine kinase and response regulator CckA